MSDEMLVNILTAIFMLNLIAIGLFAGWDIARRKA